MGVNFSLGVKQGGEKKNGLVLAGNMKINSNLACVNITDFQLLICSSNFKWIFRTYIVIFAFVFPLQLSLRCKDSIYNFLRYS